MKCMNLCLSSTFGMVLFMIAQAGSAWASAVIKEGMPLTPPKAAPNVLILLTDDQGLSDLSFYGNPSLETPHLDALAHRSVRLRVRAWEGQRARRVCYLGSDRGV